MKPLPTMLSPALVCAPPTIQTTQPLTGDNERSGAKRFGAYHSQRLRLGCVQLPELRALPHVLVRDLGLRVRLGRHFAVTATQKVTSK